MGFLSDFFSNPIDTTFDTLAKLPGTPEASLTALYQGVNGDLSWNPYSVDNSVWDMGAGGTELSQDPRNRQIGRTIGTAIGSAFTGGALGAAMGSSTAGAAASGALWGGAQAAGTGGNFLEGAAKGALSAYTPDIGGYAGITDPYIRGAVNSGLKSGVLSRLGGGDFTTGALTGAAQGTANAYVNSPPPDVGTLGGTMQDGFGESSVTTGESTPTQYGANMQAMSVDPQLSLSSFSQPQSQTPETSNSLFDQVSNLISGINPSRVGEVAQGLAGLYLGNKQRRMARDLRRQIGSNRNSYEQQLRQNLARRDAAAGRRSDYGGREVQLQAALADLDSRTAPMLSQLGTAETQGLMNMFNSGLVTGNRLGWWGKQPTAPSMPTSMPSLSSLGSPGPTASYSLIDNQNKTRYRLGGG